MFATIPDTPATEAEDLAAAYRAAVEQTRHQGIRILETLVWHVGIPEGAAGDAFTRRCRSYVQAVYDRDAAAAKLAELEAVEPAGRKP
jgi:hypothetical protein